MSGEVEPEVASVVGEGWAGWAVGLLESDGAGVPSTVTCAGWELITGPWPMYDKALSQPVTRGPVRGCERLGPLPLVACAEVARRRCGLARCCTCAMLDG
ncbi:hypothetical protein GCM10010430_35940 [Kitasatospora cystarginea]|uniref:Uncharacterized protein n=1 Tax=Kitasatospora cystarginea TaxID=58350 RepID=A0ABN3E7C9_9ACTN